MKDEDIDQEVLSYLGKLPNFTSLPWRISEYGTSTQRKSDGRDYIMTIKLMDYGANAHPDARFRCAAESDFGKEIIRKYGAKPGDPRSRSFFSIKRS